MILTLAITIGFQDTTLIGNAYGKSARFLSLFLLSVFVASGCVNRKGGCFICCTILWHMQLKSQEILRSRAILSDKSCDI